MEAQIRIAAFNWLEEQTAILGDVLSYSLLSKGFEYNGDRVTLVGPQGIWKPRQFQLIPLSIIAVSDGPYDDHTDENGFIIYRYRGTDPYHRDNMGLREAMRQKVPLIYFHGISKGNYFVTWPAFIVGDDPRSLSFTVAVDDVFAANLYSQQYLSGSNSHAFDQYVNEDTALYRRRYTTSTVKTRLHQSSFRERVLEAYRRQCAFCRLKHPELLDAAHIIPDSDSRGIPSVTNGLSLCKIHHAAFDHNIVGITPEYQIIVKDKVLRETDGPMLKHGIQHLHKQKIILPHSKNQWPDQEKIEERYAAFTNAI